MKQYKELLQKVLDYGDLRNDRTGVGCYSVFGHQMEFNLKKGFPIVSIKKTNWRAAFYEMIWFLRGDTNTKYLKDRKIQIWNEWQDKNGSIGPGYGASMRGWQYANLQNRVYYSIPIALVNGKIVDVDESKFHESRYIRTDHKEWTKENDAYMPDEWEPTLTHIDQFANFVDGLKNNPASRRHIISLWHPGRIAEQALPPCHGLIVQGFVSSDKDFDLHIYQRSCDLLIGGSFNIAQWAFFAHLVSKLCMLTPRKLIISYGDVHIYSNQIIAAQKTIKREPIEQQITLLIKRDIRTIREIETLEIDSDIEILNYKHHPYIQIPVAT